VGSCDGCKHLKKWCTLDANTVVPKKAAAVKKTAAMKKLVDKGKKKVVAAVEISGQQKQVAAVVNVEAGLLAKRQRTDAFEVGPEDRRWELSDAIGGIARGMGTWREGMADMVRAMGAMTRGIGEMEYCIKELAMTLKREKGGTWNGDEE
jgi:hypothetical protein